jgi:hypothetical protein
LCLKKYPPPPPPPIHDHRYNLLKIFEEKGIPDDFKEITITHQGHGTDAEGFRKMWNPGPKSTKKHGFSVGTSVLLPHRQHVDAVNQAIALRVFARKSVGDIKTELKKLAAPRTDPVATQEWVTCDMCSKYRMVSPTQYARYNREGVPFVCADVRRSCDEKDDSTLVDSLESMQPVGYTAVASGSPSDAEDGAAMSEDEEAGEGSTVMSLAERSP